MEKHIEQFIECNINNDVKASYSINDYLQYINNKLTINKKIRYNPIYASICITEECNMNCIHCYEKSSNKKMGLYHIEKIMHELKKHNIMQITITGGEPFLHPNIFEILKKAKELGFLVLLHSNGSLINSNSIEKLSYYLSNKTDFIQISLEGSTPQIHNHQGRHSFDKIIENIKLLVEKNIQVIINTTPSGNNQSDILNIFRLANELKVYGFKASPLAYLGKGSKLLEPNQNIVINQENLILNYDAKNIKYLGGVSGELAHWAAIPGFIDMFSKGLNNTKIASEFNCDAGITKLHIDVDYTVYPCVFAQNKDFAIGNLIEDSFSNIWFDNYKDKTYFKAVRDLKNTKCEKCKIVQKCRGGCVGLAYAQYGQINLPDPRCSFRGI